MNRPRVHRGIFRDIFGFLDRSELCYLLQHCHHVKGIIEQDFNATPYLVLPRLDYSKGQWKWSTDKNYFNNLDDAGSNDEIVTRTLVPMPPQMREELSKKFLRFEHSFFDFDHEPMDMLRELNHIWKDGGMMSIELKNFSQSTAEEFIQLVSTCSLIGLIFDGAMAMLPKFLRKNIFSISIWDSTDIPNLAELFPQEEVLEFLFNPQAKPCQPSDGVNHLSAFINRPADPQFYVDLVDNILQKFSMESDPALFEFVNFSGAVGTLLDEAVFLHPHSDKELRLQMFSNGMRIGTSFAFNFDE
ncbi:hypothetical protein Ddc_09887 [Ditylenchus destructor]|nr:hypothetical protein Ddc_09887 [Ditylenchus destructor]